MISSFESLGDVIADDVFPEVDLGLRRGQHIGRDDGPAYDFLSDALDHLEPFYRRFGAELVHKSDGYFYLLPSGDRLSRRHLSAGEMLVGQVLALLYLDPSTLELGGLVTRELLLQRLSGLVGTEDLVKTLNPQRKKFDERIAAQTVRKQVGRALRKLATLGFVEDVGDERLKLRASLMRFTEPVRDLSDLSEALERLVGLGEVLVPDSEDDDDETAEEVNL